MNKKIMIKIFIISLLVILALCTKAYGAEDGTVRMKINDGAAWVNINVSEAYEECESLNSTSSTLGTSALKAHLTTDYDWSAMAIFSVSQYGTATKNNLGTASTTNNKSGIYDINESYNRQTTTLLDTSTSTSTAFVSGLYDGSENIKKYVNKVNPSTGLDQLGRTSLAYVTDGGTYAWLGSWTYKGTDKNYPVGIKRGLFGVGVGAGGFNSYASGGPYDSVTFRPVIWN